MKRHRQTDEIKSLVSDLIRGQEVVNKLYRTYPDDFFTDLFTEFRRHLEAIGLTNDAAKRYGKEKLCEVFVHLNNKNRQRIFEK